VASGLRAQYAGDGSPDDALQERKMKDPVCGMDVQEVPQAIQMTYRGKTYYFCSPGCKRSFQQNPERYVSK
jgi:YHS domain-containing protein